MTSYTAIPNSDIDASSPVTEVLMTLLRDNAIAIAEGSSGAPRILLAAFESSIIPWVEINQTTISTDATVDFTGLDSTYELYNFVLDNVRVANDGAALRARVGTGGGPTWQTSTVYARCGMQDEDDSTSAHLASGTQAYMTLTGLCGNLASEATSGIVSLINPAHTGGYTKILTDLSYLNADATPGFERANTAGIYKSATAVTGLRFYAASGNLTSGTITLYGLRT